MEHTMTRTSVATFFPRRHALLTTVAAAAFLGAFSAAQAQGTTGSPTQTNPSATDSNSQASQGVAPSDRTRTDTMRSDTMRSDRSTSGNSSMGSTAQSGTTGSATGRPTQVNPDSQDSNRQASQGMAPDASQGAARSRVDTSSSGLRNDRTTMARAPRADRN